MKTVFVVIFFAVCAVAQDATAVAAAESACGPKNVNFDADADSTNHPTPQPDPGKALVYFVEDLGQCPGCGDGGAGFVNNVNDAIVKVGMDGSWLGAGRGASYLFFSAAPGEHHLCVNWQSRLESRSRALSFANFTAETGRVYYFRARLFPGHGDYALDLDPVNSDEGNYLVAASAASVSHPKK